MAAKRLFAKHPLVLEFVYELVLNLRHIVPESDELAGIASRLGVTAVADGETLRIEVADGAAFVPRLITALSMPVKTVTVRRPSLDDVFLKLTGRAIREGDADGMQSFMRAFATRRG